jgi:hypothetical protein
MINLCIRNDVLLDEFAAAGKLSPPNQSCQEQETGYNQLSLP